VADIGWGFIGFYPNMFPLSDLLSLPCLGVTSSLSGSLAMWNDYQKFPEMQAEYKEVKTLLVHTHQGAPLGTKKVAVKSLEDLKGLKIRSPAGGALQFLKAAGAVPMMIPSGDIYLNMQKGVIDGWTIDFIGAAGYNLGEVTAYYTTPYYYVGTFWLVMNKDTWNSLPADIQKIIEGLSGEAGIKDTYAPSFDRGDEQAKTRMGIKPDQILTVSDTEWVKWVNVAQTVWKDEVARLQAQGKPAQAILDETLKFIKNYKK
jgi:TRAP-type transport system periplasmic protein